MLYYVWFFIISILLGLIVGFKNEIVDNVNNLMTEINVINCTLYFKKMNLKIYYFFVNRLFNIINFV